MSALQIVFLDLDGTLLENREHFPSVFVRLLREHGVDCDPAAVGAAVQDIWPWYEAHVGDFQSDEMAFWLGFNRRVCQAVGAGERSEAIGSAVTEIFRGLDTPTLYDDALPCLDQLAAAGYRLGVITARPDAHRVLAPLGVVERFELLVDAFSAGSAKQDSAIYTHALDLAKTRPEQALHVGDQYTRDVEPARALGMHTVLLDRSGAQPDADCPRVQSLSQLLQIIDAM